MAIAVIGGTGRQGLGLALRWAAAGMPVVIGSRSLDRAEAAAREVRAMAGESAAVQARENLDAARAAEIIVITVPAAAHAETVAAIAPAAAGKIVVDVTVPLEKNPSYAAQLPEGSAAEAAQRALGPEARVVGAFHTVPASLLADLRRPVDCDILVCGDDAQAKARVMELAAALGTRGVDVGALRQNHTLERLTALLIGAGRKARRHELGVRITGL
ncbi:MAG TPA: NADPH-dependent F420 reductase [bacterium]|nr:NADPH-dependent F420 reductase [bacterium]